MPYSIKKPQPFVIQGEKKNYLIPPMVSLSVEDMGSILDLKPETPKEERVKAVKEFLLRMAPELKDEGLGDVGYSMIFGAYEKEQNLGK